MSQAAEASPQSQSRGLGWCFYPALQPGCEGSVCCRSSLLCFRLNACLLPSALRRQGAFLRLLCTVSTAERTCWRPTSDPSTPRVHCESLPRPEELSSCLSLTAGVCLLRAVQLASAPSKLSPPFPQIFSQAVDVQGFLHSQQPSPGGKRRPDAQPSVAPCLLKSPLCSCSPSGLLCSRPDLPPVRTGSRLLVGRAAPPSGCFRHPPRGS